MENVGATGKVSQRESKSSHRTQNIDISYNYKDSIRRQRNATHNKLCAWRHDMPRPLLPVWAPRAAEPTAAPADGNVAAVSHVRSIRSNADRCSCLCVNAAVSKPAW